MLTTTGRKLETVGQRDFLDIVYSYAINAPDMRNPLRTAMVGYLYDIDTQTKPEEDKSFEGFTKSAMSLLDQLDAGLLSEIDESEVG